MRILDTITAWWQRRQRHRALRRALESGIGTTSSSWPAGTPLTSIMNWLDEQVRTTRTPYGVSTFKVSIFVDRQVVIEQLFQLSNWQSVRSDLEHRLDPIIAREGVTVALVSFGTALTESL
jgi:hypothetical protein